MAGPATSGFSGLTEPGYGTLPDGSFARVPPTPTPAPQLLRLNEGLASHLGLSVDWLSSADGVAVLAGNQPAEGVPPLAMAYAGHQFGNWVPSLGDGRAILIGEARDRDGALREIQLKGAGRTPFSRAGDGRAALGPVLREYVVSEAMQALGIPTTRALAMLTTGDSIVRDTVQPGAILARVSAGHVRVGTFQYFHARGMTDHVRALADFVIERRYPEAAESAAPHGPYRALLDRVIAAQADLIARWMLVGFIHGVMNTDNMSILGETIDYGPCAFLDEYEPGKVFSSIDHGGRYAYAQQPNIGLWNLTRFAETLLPLLDESEEAAVEAAKDALEAYAPRFEQTYRTRLLRKIGLEMPNEENLDVASRLLERMAEQQANFTLTFRRLCDGVVDTPPKDVDAGPRSLFADPSGFDAWAADWRQRLRTEGRDADQTRAEMRATNPAMIPRNHRVQQAIDAATEGNLGPLDDLWTVTTKPFEDHPGLSQYADPPEPHERVHATFCGT
ncbi:MAG: YdiU family protein [Myxococcota bacterium]